MNSFSRVTARAGLLVALVTASAVLALTDAAAAELPGRTLVMPFDNLKHDSRILWLGEAASVLMTDELAALGANAITRTERQQAFEQLQVPPAVALTDATVIRIGELVGADRVVVGSLQLDGDTLVVRARSIALEAGRVQADVTERAALSDLYGAFERLARRVTPSAPASGDVDRRRPPVAAFESYIKGLLAETADTAIGYLNTALKLYPAFDRARLALWGVHTDQGDYRQALAVVAPIATDAQLDSPDGRRARFLAGLSQLELRKYDDAFASFKALVSRRREPAALNNLGIVQLRRGGAHQTEPPTFFFKQAAESDAGDSDYDFNLGYASWMERDTQAAIYWLREAVRRRPADGVAHYALGTALASAGDAAEAAREKELARRLSSEYAQWDRRPTADPIPKGLERVKSEEELPHTREILAKLATSGQRDQQEVAKFYLQSGRRLFDRESDRDAAAELNRALYFSPYLAEAHLLLGRIHLRNGRIHEAMDAFKISLWSAETAEGHAALGEAYRQDKDVVLARAEAERALALDPSSAEAKALVARLDGP